jgi:hypothetical protein
MTVQTFDLEKARFNPASHFKHPSDILNHPDLTHKMKVEMLKQWAYDEREFEVAEEENMINSSNHHVHVLDEILKCLLILGVDHEQDSPPPTKHG